MIQAAVQKRIKLKKMKHKQGEVGTEPGQKRVESHNLGINLIE